MTNSTMNILPVLPAFVTLGIAVSILAVKAHEPIPSQRAEAQETHLKHLKQLTFSGQNAEAYFSSDGTKLIFQSTRPPFECDQIFSMNANGSDVKLLNSGKGRTTCGFFFPEGKRFIHASTHLTNENCPPAPDRSKGYVWPIYPSYEIYSANIDDSGLKRLTKSPGCDAEGTISADGKKIVFTSMRSGDLHIYTMNADGSGTKRLTTEKVMTEARFSRGMARPSSIARIIQKRRTNSKSNESLLKQNHGKKLVSLLREMPKKRESSTSSSPIGSNKAPAANIMIRVNLVGWVEPSYTHVTRCNRTWIPACAGMTNVLPKSWTCR